MDQSTGLGPRVDYSHGPSRSILSSASTASTTTTSVTSVATPSGTSVTTGVFSVPRSSFTGGSGHVNSGTSTGPTGSHSGPVPTPDVGTPLLRSSSICGEAPRTHPTPTTRWNSLRPLESSILTSETSVLRT